MDSDDFGISLTKSPIESIETNLALEINEKYTTPRGLPLCCSLVFVKKIKINK